MAQKKPKEAKHYTSVKLFSLSDSAKEGKGEKSENESSKGAENNSDAALKPRKDGKTYGTESYVNQCCKKSPPSAESRA